MRGVTEPCPECGFDPGAVVEAQYADRFTGACASTARILAEEEHDQLVRRPAPTIWSPMEYVGHMIGVVETTSDWIRRVRSEASPSVHGVDQDAEVLAGRFNERSSQEMADRLVSATNEAADALRELTADQLARSVRFNDIPLPLGVLITAMEHELVHHLGDIRRLVVA